MSQPGPAVAGISTLRDVARRLPGRILGIDAGGSGTRVALLENGTVTVRPPGPPMNALLTDGFAGHLRRIIEAADATAAGIGMPGIRLPGQARDLSVELTRQTGCPVHVTGDADSARAGAFLGAPGVVVIAGTGSMASGWNGESSARAGGHGFLLGDEGSAYWIGRAAVRAALRFQDQMGGSGPIHRAVTRAAGQSLDALIGDICTHPAERDRLTALAPAVTALAAEDAEASRIVLEAAEHLAELAESIRRRLGPLPVAGAGGVFRAPVIWDRFAELTGAVRPAASAAVGAALLAGQHASDALPPGPDRSAPQRGRRRGRHPRRGRRDRPGTGDARPAGRRPGRRHSRAPDAG
jgi:glucosamine kinase